MNMVPRKTAASFPAPINALPWAQDADRGGLGVYRDPAGAPVSFTLNHEFVAAVANAHQRLVRLHRFNAGMDGLENITTLEGARAALARIRDDAAALLADLGIAP